MWDNFIADRVFDYDIVTGYKKPDKPDLVYFENAELAIDMLYKHIMGRKSIAIHCDVDMDGVGSGYILKRFLETQGAISRTGFIINGSKEHGINEKHVKYTYNNSNLGLFIILDSSSNELEYIKGMNCDVLVVDHHELSHRELFGDTAGGKYVIINNTIGSNEYEADKNMSCGLVTYELLRLYEEDMCIDPVIEPMRLYQWAGITLLSDVISLNNPRNQWYIDNTLLNQYMEIGLQSILNQVNPYRSVLDKNMVLYSIVPLVNVAIRTGNSAEALDIILNKPKDILNLSKYRDIQIEIVNNEISNLCHGDSYVLVTLDNSKYANYTGLIASKLCGQFNKNCAVFILEDGIAKGSFRGRLLGIDYRRCFEEYGDGVFAQGHRTAFGFQVDENRLEDIMGSLTNIENKYKLENYLTMGDTDDKYKGRYHIDDMDDFKRRGLLWRLAIANSRLSSEEIITIVLLNNDKCRLVERYDKLRIYEVEGVRCLCFDSLVTNWVELYPEYGSDGIKVYIRNKYNLEG